MLLSAMDDLLGASWSPRPLSKHTSITLGMPHLAYAGLSETWLLKHLGDLHWHLLAGLAGHDAPAFVDVQGDKVYAAFRAISLDGMETGSVGENDMLHIRSEIARISRTQFVSRHELDCGGRTIGRVELCSVFVKRYSAGHNRSIARVELQGFPPPDRDPRFSRLAALAGPMRAGTWGSHFGFDASDAKLLRQYEIKPCPAQDFNGARLLYFASFQSFIDRMEWELDMTGPGFVTTAREIFFFGNVDPGDRLRLTVMAERLSDDQCAHWCHIDRVADGVRVATAFTRKNASARV